MSNILNADQIDDMLFAWTVVKYVKSNAIIFCKDGMTVGVGAGQMSRVDAAFLAVEDANAHMHIGSVALFELGPLEREGGGLDLERLLAFAGPFNGTPSQTYTMMADADASRG